MSNFIRNGHSISLSIPNGHSIAIAPLLGIAWVVVTAGVDRGQVLINGVSEGGTFGPYPSGAVILLTSGPAESLLDFDVGLTPVNGVMAGGGITGSGGALYRQIANSDGIFRLQKKINGAWVDIQESDEDGTELATSVTTGVGSLHLGAYHSIGSGCQNVMFVNHETSLAFYPGVWQAESVDGATLVEPVSRALQLNLQLTLPNGPPAAAGVSVPYAFTLTPTVNAAFYSVRIILEENAPKGLVWVAKSAGGREFMRYKNETPRLSGDTVDIQFEYQIYLRAVDVANISVSHADTGVVIRARAGTTIPGEPYRRTSTRRFLDVPLYLDVQSLVIPAGLDSAAQYTFKLPGNRFRLRSTTGFPGAATSNMRVFEANGPFMEGAVLLAAITATAPGDPFSYDFEVAVGTKFLTLIKTSGTSTGPATIILEALP